MTFLQFILGSAGVVISIMTANFAMVRFLLKADRERMMRLEKEDDNFKDEMKTIHRKHLAMETRLDAHANRLDGIYRVILDKTYGVK